MKRIAVLTSGGDAPGMNAAIARSYEQGSPRAWKCLVSDKGSPGSLLPTLCSWGHGRLAASSSGAAPFWVALDEEFKNESGQVEALRVLHDHHIEALVVIGGNGSQAGAYALSQRGFPVVGLASTIDNDLPGSEMTIGVDTALNIALEAIDRLKVTASSHHRAFLVEVMGRDCGYIALITGITGGAEAIVIPEVETDPEAVASEFGTAYERGKAHAIVVVAEGARYNAEGLAGYFQKHRARLGFELRVTKLGHVQRGGAPGVFDRLLATRFGAAAVEQISRGHQGVLVGLTNGEIATTPLADVVWTCGSSLWQTYWRGNVLI